MLPNTDFPLDYVDFNDYDQDATAKSKAAKSLTFLGASAMSALCYETRSTVARTFQHDSKFDLVRQHDVLSHLFPLSNVVGKGPLEDLSSQQAPLMAWSNRLQVIFLAFPGTKDAGDILAGINILQVADEEKASQFHQGFYQRAKAYVRLVRSLIKRYRVVLCGHSLGGAVATITAYHAIVEEYNRPIFNTWEHDHQGLSTITFGTPTPMVVENQSTTACWHPQFAKNFHHIMNPDDPVPFLPNNALKLLEQVKTLLSVAISTLMPKQKVFIDILIQALRVWKGKSSAFAHFGRLYLLTVHGGSNKTFVCSQVANRNQIVPLGLSLSGNIGEKRYHAMYHYHFGIRKLYLDENFKDVPISEGQELNPLRQYCFPLPDLTGGGVGSIGDDRISISVKIRAPLAQYFISRVTFTQNDEEREATVFGYDALPNEDEVTLFIIQALGPPEGGIRLLGITDALIETLTIHDCFGHRSRLSIEQMDNPSLNELNTLNTDMSIRQIMILACADQISHVQSLRLDGDEATRQTDLTPKAQGIAKIIDVLVTNSIPTLVLLNFKKSLTTTMGLWGSGRITSPFEGHQALNAQPAPSSANLGKLANLIPENCDDALRGLLSSMLGSFNGKRKSILRVESTQRIYPDLVSFEQTLKDFSQKLHDCPKGREERVQFYIDQASGLLSVMHFCHFVILTQMSAPQEWFFKYRELSAKVIYTLGLSPSAIMPSFSGVQDLSFFGNGLAGAISCGTAAILLQRGYQQYQSLMIRRQQFQSDYDNILSFTAQVLRVPNFQSLYPLEVRILEKVQPQEAVGLERQWQIWSDALKKGLAELPQNTGFFVTPPEPSTFWAKWLFQVVKIGELRRFMFEKSKIGVIGPTGVGKSELLTALTSAPESVFHPGFGSQSRTLGLQSYSPEGATGVFYDCPGFDDREAAVRQMASIFPDIFDILIIVLGCYSSRSEGTERCEDEIVKLLKLKSKHHDLRPIRILLSKVDIAKFHFKRPEEFTESVIEAKNEVVERFRARLGSDFIIQSRRAATGLAGSPIVTVVERLEDIIQPFSTYAQMSYEDTRALCDCEPDMPRKINELPLYQHLCRLAEEGTMWDIISLRQWLRGFSRDIVPGGIARRPD